MHAAYYDKSGTARDVLSIAALEKPSPEAGELLVRVYASGVNPSDVKKRAGAMMAPANFDRIIPHSDGAGIVEAVGAGVNPKRVGERVWLWNAQWHRPHGTAAQWTVVPDAQAVVLPDHVTFAEGACLGIPAQTAWVATRSNASEAPGTVLVHGGAGAVGELSIIMAVQAGARVIATVSTDEKATIAQQAGAEVVHYKQTDAASRIMELTEGKGVNHIVDVDFGANWRVDAAVLANNGSICAYSAPSAPVIELDYYAFGAKAARLRFVQVYLLQPEERLKAINAITSLLIENQLPIRIAKQFGLDDIIEAHELQESGKAIGNILINVE
jgi:NADPH2:quinone reductase